MPYDPMQEFTRIMRMQQLFGPTAVTPNGPNISNSPPQEIPYDAAARMQELYQPSTAISDQYKNELMNFPQREHVGKLRMIAAAIAGLGAGAGAMGISGGAPIGFKGNPADAMKMTDLVANAPYYRKLEDFENKVGLLGKAAAEEDKQNVNKRILANDTVSRELGAAKQKEIEAQNDVKNKQADEKIKIQQQRADVYQFKAEHPDWKLVTEKGGNVFAINPQNPSDKVDTGIDSGTLSDIDKINLGLNVALKKISAQGAQTQSNQGNAASLRGTPFNIADPDDPTKQIPVMIYPDGTVKKVSIKGALVRPSGASAANKPSEKVEVIRDKNGNIVAKRTTTTGAPSSNEKVEMVSPKGTHYFVPKDKVDDAMKNYGAKRAK